MLVLQEKHQELVPKRLMVGTGFRGTVCRPTAEKGTGLEKIIWSEVKSENLRDEQERGRGSDRTS